MAIGVVSVVVLVSVLFLNSRDGEVLAGGVRQDGSIIGRVGDGPSSAPEEAWATDIECFHLCASAAAGSVIVVGETAESGSTLIGLDAATGDELWSERFSVDQISTLRVVDGVLLATTNLHDGEIIAFDPSTGDELWAMPQVSGLYYGGGTLVVGYFPGSGEFVDEDLSVMEQAEAIAVDLETGEELWDTPGSPVGVCGNTAVLTDVDEVVAVHLGSGEEAWAERVNLGMVTCSAHTVHAVSGDDLVAFDLQTGEELWSERGHSGTVAMSVLDDVLVVDGDREAMAFNISDGEELWAVDREDWEMYGLAPVGRGLGFGFDGGRGRLIDVAAGEQVASIRTGDSVSQILGPSSLLSIDGDELTSYDLSDLDQHWSIDVPEEAQGLVATDDAVFVVLPDEIVSYR